MPPALQLDALSKLLGECSLAHIRHLQEAIEPLFQRDFIRDLPAEVFFESLLNVYLLLVLDNGAEYSS